MRWKEDYKKYFARINLVGMSKKNAPREKKCPRMPPKVVLEEGGAESFVFIVLSRSSLPIHKIYCFIYTHFD